MFAGKPLEIGQEVIVVGLSPTGLYAVREAKRAGYRVVGVGAPGAPGLWSRDLSVRIKMETAEGRVQAIIEHLSTAHKHNNRTKPVLIITSDQDLEAVMARADELSQYADMQETYCNGLAAQILDKDQFYCLCDKNDIPYPKLCSAPVNNASALRDKVTYPCIVKPARIQEVKHLMSGKKGWVLESAADFDRIVPTIPSEAGTILMQEIIPGPEHLITLWCGYIDKSGDVRQRFTARKLRQYPPGFGSASLVQSEVDEESAEMAERLLVALGYHGIAAAEFKRHPKTGALTIIEVNPRPSLWFSVSTAAGVLIVKTAIAELTGNTLPDRATQKNGVRWRYLIKDLATMLFYYRSKNFVLPAPDTTFSGSAKSHADVVGTLRDPGPAVAETIQYIRKFLSRLRVNKAGN